MTLQQLDFNRSGQPPGTDWNGDVLCLDSRRCPVIYRRNDRATRYRLTVGRDGLPRITIPRRGSRKAAEQFALQHRAWLLKQIERHDEQRRLFVWSSGTPVLFRGEITLLQLENTGPESFARLGQERFALASRRNIRTEVESQLRQLAARELPARVAALAANLGARPRKVVVRAQVSRWGSCSCRGTISLNWRLIQLPPDVRDYIILHELTHLREMNHSSRFWALVAQACPGFKKSEAWLRMHSQALL